MRKVTMKMKSPAMDVLGDRERLTVPGFEVFVLVIEHSSFMRPHEHHEHHVPGNEA